MNPHKLRVQEELSFHLSAQLSLCERLENLANGLPTNVNRQECLILANCVLRIIYEAHHFEENYIFPILHSSIKDEMMLEKNIERLRFEHWEDEALAEDISASLRNYVTAPHECNIDALSYMLRAFFEGIRRHIAFETEYVISRLEMN